MAGGRPARERAGVVESIEQFMDRRARETGDFARAAYEGGREQWNEATRAGRDLRASRPSDVVALGRKALDAGAQAVDRTLGNSKAARVVAGTGGYVVGAGLGFGRGAVHAARDLTKGAVFVERAVNPYDPLHDETVVGTVRGVGDAAKRGAAYASDRVVHPQHLRDDVTQLATDTNATFNPGSTPMAATPSAEFARAARFGANGGEAAFNAVSLAYGGGESRMLARLAGLGDATTAEKLVKLGHRPADAAHLAGAYDGAGSHFFITQARGRELGLPKWVVDHPLNVSKPDISRYDFYRHHFEVDPDFYGTPMPGRRGAGSGFSGRREGFQKREGLDRLWHGAPATSKALVGGVAGAPIGVYRVEREEGSQ